VILKLHRVSPRRRTRFWRPMPIRDFEELLTFGEQHFFIPTFRDVSTRLASQA